MLKRLSLLFLSTAILGLLLAACGGGGEATATPRPGGTPPPGVTATAPPLVAVTPAAFFLDVTAPQNESTVKAATIEVKGRTVADAVVSVNGQAVQVNADGTFSTNVKLDEGPNTIEVIASDFQGNKASRVLTVIFVP